MSRAIWSRSCWYNRLVLVVVSDPFVFLSIATPRTRGADGLLVHAGTIAIQLVRPNFPLNFSASSSARARLGSTAKVVEPLPDIRMTGAPLARRNSWNNASNGYFSNAGASREL